jgi:hypothetical protein
LASPSIRGILKMPCRTGSHTYRRSCYFGRPRAAPGALAPGGLAGRKNDSCRGGKRFAAEGRPNLRLAKAERANGGYPARSARQQLKGPAANTERSVWGCDCALPRSLGLDLELSLRKGRWSAARCRLKIHSPSGRRTSFDHASRKVRENRVCALWHQCAIVLAILIQKRGTARIGQSQNRTGDTWIFSPNESAFLASRTRIHVHEDTLIFTEKQGNQCMYTGRRVRRTIDCEWRSIRILSRTTRSARSFSVHRASTLAWRMRNANALPARTKFDSHSRFSVSSRTIYFFMAILLDRGRKPAESIANNS